MVLIVVLSSLNSFAIGAGSLVWIIAVISIALVLLECRRVQREIWITSSALLFISFLLLPFINEPTAALEKGLGIGAIFASLVASVSILGKSALRTQTVTQISDLLGKVNIRTQYFTYSVASQLLSGMLSLAGTNVLFAIATKKYHSNGNLSINRSTFGAIARGFSAATFWSPMFGNMSIMLALYPALSWSEVFPLGFMLAQITLLIGVLLYRFTREESDETGRLSSESIRIKPQVLCRLVIVLIAYISCLMLISVGFQASITTAIVFTAPITALLINTFGVSSPNKIKTGIQLTFDDINHLSRLTPEILIFLTAGIVGIVLAQSIPEPWIQDVSTVLYGHVWFSLIGLMMAIVILSLIGLHPILSAVMLATSLTPTALGVSDISHFGAILMGWGIAASLTPFSVLNLTGSHLSGIPLVSISIKENWCFSLISLVIVSSVLTIVNYFATK